MPGNPSITKSLLAMERSEKLSNSGSYLSLRRSLEYAEEHYEFIAERYRLNQSSVSDYIDAFTLLVNSKNSLIKVSYGFLQSLSKLRSLGAIDDDEKLIGFLIYNLPGRVDKVR